jgi:guanine nucleotide-binding protein subunit beta-2-like 1 protein
MTAPNERLTFAGELIGHGGWVTALQTGSSDHENLLVSVSRDKTLCIWNVRTNVSGNRVESVEGIPHRVLTGHNHFISDVALSIDNNFALTGSWDKTMRLWDLNAGRTTYRYFGHTKDVLSVTMSPDNSQFISGSRDKSVRLWNTLGEYKYTFEENKGHTDWVTCVRFTPVSKEPLIVTAGWDRTVKLWRRDNLQLKANLIGHTNCVNTVTLSPDGHFCASGGKDNQAMIWDIQEGKQLYFMDAFANINALCFSPTRYWLVAATDAGIIVWDLETKRRINHIQPDVYLPDSDRRIRSPKALSVAWSHDGEVLYAGFSDNKIRAYSVVSEE